ncbi:sugar phosphate isomerase/epimerase [Labedella gwakjiensis]|uniref:Sugar phosphate isomerase/epimerase n=1 Tax=Labedella gwakjiensis TaxID=390269 RepID=A0A2P8GUG9_9MICO|nr:sugar phosphate isomerase/epimerase family protein [Labedella gwakjiensis]PSL37609.1 sugar phosphate isomerase/epimerase [Labedella gwakjiensis]RUQ81702.1 sugar phosphate isomerase/epimerase [Labedella gwakjiensis]
MSATGTARRLSINQWTVRRASIPELVSAAVGAGVPAVGLWREALAEFGVADTARAVVDAGLRVSSLCRGGFFTDPEPRAARAAHDGNLRAIEEAHDVGAPVLVLVAGGLPAGSRDLAGARERVRDAIGAIADAAAAAQVVLAIEPLHPMYVADRAVVSTLGQALDIAEQFPADAVGVVVDTFHVWWDPEVLAQIARAGRGGRIASYQVCDFPTPIPADVLLARGMMGDGHIDFGPLTSAVSAAGYRGDVEVEIFNQDIWDADPSGVVRLARERFEALVAPFLDPAAEDAR